MSGKSKNKALLIGINHYSGYRPPLHGCVNDVAVLKPILEYHDDGTKNFDVDTVISANQSSPVSTEYLKKKIEEFYAEESDVALFYFSGHGGISKFNDENQGKGFLISSDSRCASDGVAMEWLLEQIKKSKIKRTFVILDCCHAGAMINLDTHMGLTILAATRHDDTADEKESGVFTTILVEALRGGAADVLGYITAAGLYAHIDKSMGKHEQRPVLKSNVKEFVPIRRVRSQVPQHELELLIKFFDNRDSHYSLNSTYEETCQDKNEENVKLFKVLQRYNRVNIVVPVGEEHMYYAAVYGKACRLTPLGKYYWLIAKNKQKLNVSAPC